MNDTARIIESMKGPLCCVLTAGPYTGGAANPARVLGPAIVFNDKWGDVSHFCLKLVLWDCLQCAGCSIMLLSFNVRR